MITRLTVISLVLMSGLFVLVGCNSFMSDKERMMKKEEIMKKEEMKKEGMMKDDKMMEEKSGTSSSKGMSKPKGTWKVRTAKLSGIGSHQAAGTVLVSTEKQDAAILTLAHLSVDRVPDGRVYLAKGGDYTKGVELGKLMQFSGTAAFSIPTGIAPEDYDSVVIWCKKFNVGIGRAFFEAKAMDGEAAMIKK